MIGAVLAVTVVVLVVVAVLASKRVQHPDQASDRRTDERAADGDTTSTRFYDPTDRPAGPDADEPVGGTNRRPDPDEA